MCCIKRHMNDYIALCGVQKWFASSNATGEFELVRMPEERKSLQATHRFILQAALLVWYFHHTCTFEIALQSTTTLSVCVVRTACSAVAWLQ